MAATSTKKPELEQLVELLTKALNDTKSKACDSKPALDGKADQALREYKAISASLRGFPNKKSDKETDPRWKLPPLSPRADT